MHPCQFGGAIQHATTDAGVQLVHNIRQGWLRNLDSTVLLFDVSSFYTSVQWEPLVAILRKQGFASEFCDFMVEYLKDRVTSFRFNNQVCGPVEITMGVGQGSCLSPVLSGLYLAPVLHKWAPVDTLLEGNIQTQFFVDDGLFHAISDDLNTNVRLIRWRYRAMAEDLARIGVFIGTDKFELVHFRKDK